MLGASGAWGEERIDARGRWGLGRGTVISAPQKRLLTAVGVRGTGQRGCESGHLLSRTQQYT